MIWQSENKKWTIIRIDLDGSEYAAIINDERNGKTFTVTGTDCGTYFSVERCFEGTKQDLPFYLVKAVADAAQAAAEEKKASAEVEIQPLEDDTNYKKKKGSIWDRFSVLPGYDHKRDGIPIPPPPADQCELCGGTGRVADDILCWKCEQPLQDGMMDPVIKIGDGVKISMRDMQLVLRALNEIRECGEVKAAPDLAEIVIIHLNEMGVDHSVHRDWDGKILITMMDPAITAHLTLDQKIIFLGVYANHLKAMGTDMRAKHTADHIDKVIWDEDEKCIKIYFDYGEWWHYARGVWW